MTVTDNPNSQLVAAESLEPLTNIALLRRALQRAIDRKAGRQDSPTIHISPLCYPGLRSFAPSEGEIFLGREDACGEIQDLLARRRTLCITGGSGSGKSSLVRAGLLPFLNSNRRIAGRDGRWFSVECKPGDDDPMESLWSALERMLVEQFPEDARAARPAETSPHRHRLERAERNADRLDQMVRELDRLDSKNSKGRSGAANLLLLIDQFEEVFRPSIKDSLRQETLDLLVVCHNRIERAASVKDEKAPGLFVVLTMRSEELHRCTGHAPLPAPEQSSKTIPGSDNSGNVARSMTDVVNSSIYLLRLLDMEEDRRSLSRAALLPARKVMADYEIPFIEKSDQPFEDGVIGWLLSGAAEIGGGAGHQPDQMPLLQHALRQMWLNALTDPQNDSAGEDGKAFRPLRICKRHLFTNGTLSNAAASDDDQSRAMKAEIRKMAEKAEKSDRADVKACLEIKAKRTAMQAQQAVAKEVNSQSLGDAPLQAMCRALARRDDRGNWARRYADIESIDTFLKYDHRAEDCTDERRRVAIEVATAEFVREGLLQAERARYDIGHEALIRNWEQCLEWLRPLVDLGVALSDSVRRLGPRREPGHIAPKAKYLVEERLADELSPLDPQRPILPSSWAEDELMTLLSSKEARDDWGLNTPSRWDDNPEKRRIEANRVLKKILDLRDEAQRQRQTSKILFRGAIGSATLAMLAVIWFWAAQSASNNLATVREWRTNIVHAEAIAANVTVPDQSPRGTVQQHAVELLAAANVWEDARSGLSGMSTSNRTFDHFVNWISGVTGEIEGSSRDLELAERRIDEAARALLGRTFSIVPDFSPTGAQPPKCLDVSSKSDTLGDGTREVFVSPSPDGSFQPELRTADGNGGWKTVAVTLGRLPNVGPETKMCLSADDQILTVTGPGQSLPQISVLGWYKSVVGLDGTPKEQALVTQVDPPIYIQEFESLGSKLPTLHAVVREISDRDEATGERKLRFELITPDGQVERKLLASFFEGYAAPILSSVDKGSGQKCQRQHKADESQDNAKAEGDARCTVHFEDGTVLKAVDQVRGTATGTYLQVAVPFDSGPTEIVRERLPRTSLPVGTAVDGKSVPPEFDTAELGGNYSELLLYDARDQWKLRLFTDVNSIAPALRHVVGKYAPNRDSWSYVCKQEDCWKAYPDLSKQAEVAK